MSRDCSKSEATAVSDTNGDSKLEDNTPRLPEEEEKLSVSRERKNDPVIKLNSIQFNISIYSLLKDKIRTLSYIS